MMNTHNPFSNTRALGTACMLAASLCFSTGGLLMKLIPWNPLAINGARNLIACMVIGLYILVTHHKIKFNDALRDRQQADHRRQYDHFAVHRTDLDRDPDVSDFWPKTG